MYSLLCWGYHNNQIKNEYKIGYVAVIDIVPVENKLNITYLSLEYNFTDYELIKHSNFTYTTTLKKYVNPTQKKIASEKPYVSNLYILFCATSYLSAICIPFLIVFYGLKKCEKNNYIAVDVDDI